MNSHIQRSTLTIKRKDLQTILRFGRLPRNAGPLRIELERILTRHAQSCVTFSENRLAPYTWHPNFQITSLAPMPRLTLTCPNCHHYLLCHRVACMGAREPLMASERSV